MALRTYQLGDYDNTILRKVLENDSQSIGGSLPVNIRTGTATQDPRYYQPGDNSNTILRKILENQSRVIGGSLVLHLR